MKTLPVEVSARHIHLSLEDWQILFGAEEIALQHKISQPGQFVAKQRISLHGPRGVLNNIAIVGPCRGYTQCEVSQTDARALGVTPPLSHSGNLAQAARVWIVGPKGKVERASVVIAHRHLHVTPSIAKKLKLEDQQLVTMRLSGVRGVSFTNVVVRVHPKSYTCLHIDTDEGNACGYTVGMTATLSK